MGRSGTSPRPLSFRGNEYLRNEGRGVDFSTLLVGVPNLLLQHEKFIFRTLGHNGIKAPFLREALPKAL